MGHANNLHTVWQASKASLAIDSWSSARGGIYRGNLGQKGIVAKML